MSFTTIPPSWILAGNPTKEELFQYIKDNQDCFNADIELLKQTSAIDIIDVSIDGFPADYTTSELQEYMPVFRAPVTGTITSVRLALLQASTSGTLQIDLEKSTDNGANWTPLLTTPVAITGTSAGDISGAVNFVNTAAQDFNQNDLIRIVFTGAQVGQGAFHVSVYGELA